MSSENFPKEVRLLSKADFGFLKSGSTSSKAKWLMAYSKNSVSKQTRIGISASKKVGCAVKRNTVKRSIREFFRKSDYKELGKDILLVVHPQFFKDNSVSPALKIDESLNKIFQAITSK
jgi:ribonuclease P protein component